MEVDGGIKINWAWPGRRRKNWTTNYLLMRGGSRKTIAKKRTAKAIAKI